MKYYEKHEEEYRKRLAKGQVAWDEGKYEQFDMLALVKRFIKESNFDSSQSYALDIGCGTGGLACYLASRGFKVTAIDVSGTAIGEAKNQAFSRGVKVDFKVADICREQLPENAYDLVTDNHFLHCIVFSQERNFVLQNIRRALTANGEYWIETMVGHPKMKPRDEWHLDNDGISWLDVSGNGLIEGCIERDGQIWFPMRRIQPSDKILIEELRQAGFEIVWHETSPPMNENDTGTFRAKCRPMKKKDQITVGKF
jgi:SAM-dependent methyltransferase